MLIAVERHLDGATRQAFAVGFFAALDRPEIWLFWGPYGLWLFWKDPGARKLVVALFVLIPVLWFLPELWGSGHLLRGVKRAQHPRSNSPAFAKCPFCTEFKDDAWPTVLLPLKTRSSLCVRGRVRRCWRMRAPVAAREPAARPAIRAPHARCSCSACSASCGGSVIALHDPGRLLGQQPLPGARLGAGRRSPAESAWGWVARRWGGSSAGWRGRHSARRSVTAPAVALRGRRAGGAGAVPVRTAVDRREPHQLPRTHRALVYQAHLRTDLTPPCKRRGPAALLACGTVMTEGFQVPMVAWTLGVRTLARRSAEPGTMVGAAGPNVILQTRAQPNSTLLPLPGQILAWEREGAHYKLIAHDATFRVFSTCPG